MIQDPLIRYDAISFAVTKQGWVCAHHIRIDPQTRRVISTCLDRYILEGQALPSALQGLADTYSLLCDRMGQGEQMRLF